VDKVCGYFLAGCVVVQGIIPVLSLLKLWVRLWALVIYAHMLSSMAADPLTLKVNCYTTSWFSS